MKLNDLITLFVDITKDCDIAQLGPPYSYYYSDMLKSNLLAKDVYEIDVKSAFPTICKLYFGEEHPFVKAIFARADKLERNIFIATTLKQQAEQDGGHYLNELNLWSKILVLGYTYCKYENISVLQYVKDGVIIKGTLKDNIDKNRDDFLNYIFEHEIIFHEKPINYYIRFNKTSVIKTGTSLDIKGKFRNLPKFIEEYILPSFFNGEIYNKDLLSEIKKIYSMVYFSILKEGKLLDKIEYYYAINEKQFLNIQEKFGSISELYPKMYLIGIIYPILALFRINQYNI